MINIISKIKEKNTTEITTILINIIITIVTCIMPFIVNLTLKSYIYYAIGLSLIILLVIKRKELKFDKKDKVLLVYLLLAFISTVFSLSIKTSILGAPGRYEGVLMIIIYALLYYTAKNFFKYHRSFFKIIFAVVTIVAIYSICQFYDFMPVHDFFDISYIRFYTSGTMNNPNFLATYITIFLPIIMAIYLMTNKKIFMLLTLILFASLVCTLTRSAWVAFLIYCLLCIIYMIIHKKKEYFIRAVILLLCFIMIFVILKSTDMSHKVEIKSSVIVQEVTKIIKEGVNENMGSSRIFIWRLCIESIPKYALFGCGVDNLKEGLIKSNPFEFLRYIENSNAYIDKAHNEYLQIAVTMGIPALVCYLTFIALILEDKIKNLFKSRITFIFVISIVGYLVQAFFNVSVIQVAPFFWILLGLSDNTDFINKLKEKHNFLTR